MPSSSPPDLIAAYDQIAPHYASDFSEPTHFIDAFLARLAPGARIFDVGCGPGVDIAYCIKIGFPTDGLDLSPAMVALARARCPEADVHLGDLLTFQTNRLYDACLASFSLIHLPKADVPRALTILRGLLKTGGHLYVAVQAGPSQEKCVRSPLAPVDLFLNIFSQEELQALLEKAGFRTLATRTAAPASPGELAYTKLILFAEAL